MTKLKEFVLQIDFVKNCYVLWDDSYHHLHLYFSIKKNVVNCHNINIKIMKYLCKLNPLYRPDKIHFMNHIEFTSSGKISLEHSKEHYIQDKIIDKIINNIDLQQIEVAFKSIWENNLQRKNIGFVKLGGTSIVALQISNAMSEISNIEFPKLIGMLLMDSTIDECLNYIKSIVLNNQNGIIDLKSHNNIRELPLITVITIEDEKSFRDSNKKNKKYNSTIQVNDIQLCQWYKCRGQIYNYISDINEEFKLQYDTISKVKIQKTYDMRKCVDASPTIFRYSE